MSTIFQYNEPIVPEDCYHRISPSQIDKFFTYPKLYYNENVQGQKPEFQGNDSTIIGTICHHIYKEVALGNTLDRESINKELREYAASKPELNLNVSEIEAVWPNVVTTVVNEYVLREKYNKGALKLEESVCIKLGGGVYLAGTYDRLEGSTIVDYKTVSIKPNENQIPFGYKIQLLAYAYALRQTGHLVENIRLVYGVKPTKTLSARCFVVEEPIDYVSEKLINDTLRLMTESVIICKNQPELVHLIFRSMDLKQ